MATYRITIYGDPVLRERAEPVADVNDEIRQLAEDMVRTMHAEGGLGLAAEQVGRRESICVIDVPPDHDHSDQVEGRANPDVRMPLVLINPEITESNGEQLGKEGCLSFPEIFVNVMRAEFVTVRFTDADNRPCTVKARGLLARAIQHELDHLNGVLLVDRMSAVQKASLVGRLRRLKKRGRVEATA